MTRDSRITVDGGFTLSQAAATWKRLRDLLSRVEPEAQELRVATPLQADSDPAAPDGVERASGPVLPGDRR